MDSDRNLGGSMKYFLDTLADSILWLVVILVTIAIMTVVYSAWKANHNTIYIVLLFIGFFWAAFRRIG